MTRTVALTRFADCRAPAAVRVLDGALRRFAGLAAAGRFFSAVAGRDRRPATAMEDFLRLMKNIITLS
ncbi:MAG: hypothetical protein RML12_09200 [Xanthomonadales bacterium]|nr:hypothetical protein [Xanthomonadales bacterium]